MESIFSQFDSCKKKYWSGPRWRRPSNLAMGRWSRVPRLETRQTRVERLRWQRSSGWLCDLLLYSNLDLMFRPSSVFFDVPLSCLLRNAYAECLAMADACHRRARHHHTLFDLPSLLCHLHYSIFICRG
jgi:hypothetical protein